MENNENNELEKPKYTKEFVFDRGDMFFRVSTDDGMTERDTDRFLGMITDVTVTRKMLPLYAFSDQNYQTNMDSDSASEQFAPKPFEEVKKVLDSKCKDDYSYIIINPKKGDVFTRDFLTEKFLEIAEMRYSENKNKASVDTDFLRLYSQFFGINSFSFIDGLFSTLIEFMYECGIFNDVISEELSRNELDKILGDISYYILNNVLIGNGMPIEEMKKKGIGGGTIFYLQNSCVLNKKILTETLSKIKIDTNAQQIRFDTSITSFDGRKTLFDCLLITLEFLFGKIGGENSTEKDSDIYDKAYLIANLVADFLDRRNDFDNLVNELYNEILENGDESLFEIISMI